MQDFVLTYKPGLKNPRRFGRDQWERMKKLKRTNGYVELRPGQTIPAGQQKTATPIPPEVKDFPLKTRKELESGIRNEVSSEFQQRLDESAERERVLREQLAAAQAAKVEAPKAEAEKQSAESHSEAGNTGAQTTQGTGTTQATGTGAATGAQDKTNEKVSEDLNKGTSTKDAGKGKSTGAATGDSKGGK